MRKNKRTTPSSPTKIYSYGCRFPTQNAAIMDEQIYLAHQYRKKLTEIEQARRVEIVTARGALPDLAPLEAQVTALVTELAALRAGIKAARAGKKGKPPPIDQERVKAVKAALKVVRAEVVPIRLALKEDPRLLAIYVAADERAAEAVRAARAECGVYWGTYLLVEKAFEQAKEFRPRPDFDGKPPPPWHELPRFPRWTGDGRIGVQLQKGLSVAEAFTGTDTRLRIKPLEPLPAGKRLRRTHTRTEVRLRVGTVKDGRDPIWATVPFNLHRELPPDGIIKWAWVHRRRVGLVYKYELQITVESPAHVAPKEAVGNGTIAINLGWRNLAGGKIRVAYWVDDEGEHGQILVPERTVVGLNKVEDLRSIRDKNFNLARAELSAWASTHTVPSWFSEDTATMAQWRATNRLARLIRVWATQRFDGDDDILKTMQAWRKQDRHLLTWEAEQREGRLDHRKEEYLVLAARMTTRYSTILLEEFHLPDVLHTQLPEEGPESVGNPQRATAKVASPGMLRAAIEAAAVKRGAHVVKQKAVNMTQTCHVCRLTTPWDAAPRVNHTCASCGSLWDQDFNNCMNQLRAHGIERPGDASPQGGARTMKVSDGIGVTSEAAVF